MKLTLTLLLVFGLIAFTVAAPATESEEAVEDPKDLEQDPEEEELNDDDHEMMGMNEFDENSKDEENDDVDVAESDPKRRRRRSHCRCLKKGCRDVSCRRYQVKCRRVPSYMRTCHRTKKGKTFCLRRYCTGRTIFYIYRRY